MFGVQFNHTFTFHVFFLSAGVARFIITGCVSLVQTLVSLGYNIDMASHAFLLMFPCSLSHFSDFLPTSVSFTLSYDVWVLT